MLFLLMIMFNLNNSCLDYIYLEIIIVNVCLAANFMISPGYLPLSCCYADRICYEGYISREWLTAPIYTLPETTRRRNQFKAL